MKDKIFMIYWEGDNQFIRRNGAMLPQRYGWKLMNGRKISIVTKNNLDIKELEELIMNNFPTNLQRPERWEKAYRLVSSAPYGCNEYTRHEIECCYVNVKKVPN